MAAKVVAMAAKVAAMVLGVAAEVMAAKVVAMAAKVVAPLQAQAAAEVSKLAEAVPWRSKPRARTSARSSRR